VTTIPTTDDAGPGSVGTALRVAALAALVALPVTVLSRMATEAPPSSDPFIHTYGAIAAAAYLVPGAILLLRRRWHVVGWLLCLIAVGMSVTFAGDWGSVWFGGPWMTWLLSSFTGSLFWLPIAALLVVFPDGLASQPPGQRRLGWSLLSVGAVMALLEVLASDVAGTQGVIGPSPLGDLAVVPTSMLRGGVTTLVTDITLLIALIGLIGRYRSSNAAAQRQYRWVLSAIVVLGVAVAAAVVATVVTGDENSPWWLGALIAYLGLPIAFMVAILRYRLYEIDRIVSRTVTYSLVLAVLAAVYLLAIGLMTQVLPGDSDVAIAASTLAATAVFRPVHQRVRHAVERRFNRPRFDAEQEMQRFAHGLRGQLSLQAVEADLAAVVDRTLRPTTLTLWIRRS
jgi:hypothetical protein